MTSSLAERLSHPGPTLSQLVSWPLWSWTPEPVPSALQEWSPPRSRPVPSPAPCPALTLPSGSACRLLPPGGCPCPRGQIALAPHCPPAPCLSLLPPSSPVSRLFPPIDCPGPRTTTIPPFCPEPGADKPQQCPLCVSLLYPRNPVQRAGDVSQVTQQGAGRGCGGHHWWWLLQGQAASAQHAWAAEACLLPTPRPLIRD